MSPWYLKKIFFHTFFPSILTHFLVTLFTGKGGGGGRVFISLPRKIGGCFQTNDTQTPPPLEVAIFI